MVCILYIWILHDMHINAEARVITLYYLYWCPGKSSVEADLQPLSADAHIFLSSQRTLYRSILSKPCTNSGLFRCLERFSFIFNPNFIEVERKFAFLSSLPSLHWSVWNTNTCKAGEGGKAQATPSKVLKTCSGDAGKTLGKVYREWNLYKQPLKKMWKTIWALLKKRHSTVQSR